MKTRSGARRWLGLGHRLLLVTTAFLLICALACLLAGCGVRVGVTQELKIDEPLGSATVTDIEIAMGAGKLTIAPGAAGLASGVVRYNIEPWVPKVVRGEASLSIKQGAQKTAPGLNSKIVNDWNLQLGRAPMRLKVSAGAYEGSYDLSGLTLQDLTIRDGAAKAQVTFDSPNPGLMSSLVYETGASNVQLSGLANANFKSMSFTGGAGSYSLDFSGQLRTSATVKVESGAGSVKITVPSTTAAKVDVYGSLNHVSTDGPWAQSGSVYSTPAAADAQAKLLTITLKMSVGAVSLVTK